MHKGIVPKRRIMESSSMSPSPKTETRDRDAVDSQQRQSMIMIVIVDCYLFFVDGTILRWMRMGWRTLTR